MKGLLNNEQAVNVLNNLKGSLDNRIHQIYNLGYKEGYKDGQDDFLRKLTDEILAEKHKNETDCFGASLEEDWYDWRDELGDI